jgi:hypothetical protein
MVMAPSITEAQMFTALGNFLTSILGSGVDVLQGQLNRVAEPSKPDFVVMWGLNRPRLATNVDSWDITADAPTALSVQQSTQVDVQLDIHGPNSTDNAQTITTLWRDEYATRAIDAAVMTPLFATDGHQMPFVNGEQQYEDRWVVTVSMQMNPVISTPMDFAANLSANISAIGSANP